MGQIEQHADIHVNKVLVGNKCDSPKVQVTEAEGQALADRYGMKFFLTSAKANTGVTEVFESIARDVKNRLLKEGVGKKVQPAPVVITQPVKAVNTGGGGGAANGPNCCAN